MKTLFTTLCPVLVLLTISCTKENISIGEESLMQHDITLSTASYPSVTIGTQVWMQENLKVSRYRNGDYIPQVKDSAKWAKLTTGAWCWYNNDSATGAVYGKLYNWYAINDPRGLAPRGWHIPSDSEWRATEPFLGTWTHAAGNMKETGTTHWFDPNIDATNISGFTALPGGYRSEIGQFCYINYLGLWWTSTEYNTSLAWYRRMLCFTSCMDWWRSPKQMGFSVRCIRN